MPPSLPEHTRLSEAADSFPTRRRTRLRRLIILVILVSVGAHLIFGITAGIWVIARYLTQPKSQFVVQKQVQMNPEDRQHRMEMEQVASMRPKPVYNNRIQSIRPAKLALPDLPKVPTQTIVPLDTEALITDAVDGMGKYGQGNGTGGGFFGGAGNPNSGLLEGMLYDLKQQANGTPSKIGEGLGAEIGFYKNAVSRLLASGARDSAMRGFYKVPQKLYLAQLAIPNMNADAAPRAFNSNIQPRLWVIVYRGLVAPPKDGTYRFAGSADDVLLVRFNNRIVLEGSLGPARITDWESKDPTSKRGGWGKDFGDPHKQVVYGDWITMKAGQFYPIEVIVGEMPGTAFYANLHIQEKDVEYAKGPDGKPVLPLFRMQANLKTPAKLYRPVAENGPIFKAITSRQTASGL